MNPLHFSIRSTEFGALNYTKSIPNSLLPFILPKSDQTLAYCASGHILIQEIKTTRFVLWHYTILLEQDDSFQLSIAHPIFSINFCLQNSFSFSNRKPTETLTIYEGQYNLSYFQNLAFTAQFTAHKVYSYVSLFLSKALLLNCSRHYPSLECFLENIDRPEATLLYPSNPYTTKQIRKILFSLLRVDCQNDETGQIIKDGKALELLVKIAEFCQPPASSTLQHITKEDAEKIYAAKTWLSHQLNRPVTLYELARKVGLNVHKLSSGFQKITGSTIFHYHRKMRMARAVQLLQETDRDLFDIGTEIGYMDGKTFSKEFKKIKGIPPLEYRRQVRFHSYAKN